MIESHNSPAYLLTPPFPFHLDYTLRCGQIFGWRSFDGGYLGFVGDSPLHLKKEGGALQAVGAEKAVRSLRCFFRWDDPLEAITGGFRGDPLLSKALDAFPGLRIIRQNPWHCLVGFILSIYSNIPKIEATLRLLARKGNNKIHFLGVSLHGIPSPGKIARMQERTLRGLGMGFRARYLRESAREIAGGFPLESLQKLPYREAKKALMTLPGIGEKVADCILLFGLNHLEAFPVDVWMQRILQQHYFKGDEKTPNYLSEWGQSRFGPFAGYAQQYLYAFSRGKLYARTSKETQTNSR